MDLYEKSLEMLKKITKSEHKYGYRIFLLGGWAVWLYNPYMKSKDIDFIVEKEHFWKLSNFAATLGFRETSPVLQKHGFSMLWEDDKIELDVYTEKIGRWPVEMLIDGFLKIKGIRVLSPTKLFMLKSFTALERRGTAKGEKDLSDVLAILDARYMNIDFELVRKEVDLQKVLHIILSDFKTASNIYPMDIEKYKDIKTYIKNLGLLD